MGVLAESVAVASDGSLYMLDKFGFVWRAPPDGSGGYSLEKEPRAQLGPGRPLGFHFDAEGNLIVCNSGAVGPDCVPNPSTLLKSLHLIGMNGSRQKLSVFSTPRILSCMAAKMQSHFLTLLVLSAQP
jgi:sugar lactone lactonase YvrE